MVGFNFDTIRLEADDVRTGSAYRAVPGKPFALEAPESAWAGRASVPPRL
jgi:hypothetical protein